ncbi:integrase core domain-containing protein [Pantoea stewartii]|uniref:integrase core domain-containing protein n=1 Tax=Pantoea stewartii TaxID=66269 RepID=UPI00197D55D0
MFTSRVFEPWSYVHGVELCLIQPGKPALNGFIEHLYACFHDECLHKRRFRDRFHNREVMNNR